MLSFLEASRAKLERSDVEPTRRSVCWSGRGCLRLDRSRQRVRTKVRDDGSLRGGEHAGLIAVTKLDKRAFEPCLSHPEEKWKWNETVGERSDTSGEASAKRPVYEPRLPGAAANLPIEWKLEENLSDSVSFGGCD